MNTGATVFITHNRDLYGWVCIHYTFFTNTFNTFAATEVYITILRMEKEEFVNLHAFCNPNSLEVENDPLCNLHECDGET